MVAILLPPLLDYSLHFLPFGKESAVQYFSASGTAEALNKRIFPGVPWRAGAQLFGSDCDWAISCGQIGSIIDVLAYLQLKRALNLAIWLMLSTELFARVLLASIT